MEKGKANENRRLDKMIDDIDFAAVIARLSGNHPLLSLHILSSYSLVDIRHYAGRHVIGRSLYGICLHRHGREFRNVFGA